jgi:magnesium transporter
MMLVTLVWRGLTPALPVVGLSIFLIICNAAAVGLTVPSLIHALRLNPEVAAGPVTLAMVDIFTLLFYFGTATLIL